MEVAFSRNSVRPGDPNFQYDVQVVQQKFSLIIVLKWKRHRWILSQRKITSGMKVMMTMIDFSVKKNCKESAFLFFERCIC